MVLLFLLFFLFSIAVSGITTIPLPITFLAVCAVVLRKSWVFFAAFGLGLFLDLILVRSLGYTSLIFTIFIFIIRLYERKFETRTVTFVFISTFLGSLIYLLIFGYNNVLTQLLVSALVAILLFKTLNSKFKVQN